MKGELDWIVMKALEKDRTRRYEAASALARDVERYLQQEPVEACPPSARYRLGKFLRRHRTGALAAAAGLVLLVAGAAVSTWQAVRATRAERTAAAVSEFLQNDLLGQADLANQPGEGAGRDPDVTVRTLLDRAAQSIEGKFRKGAADGGRHPPDGGQGLSGAGPLPGGRNGSSSDRWSCTRPSLGKRRPGDPGRSKSSLAYLYGAQGKVRPRGAAFPRRW